MHIHMTQSNPEAQLNAAYAAQQAQARREAEATRKKLTEFASKLAAASEQDIWANWSQPENPDRQFRQGEQNGQPESGARRSLVSHSISDWA